MCPVAITLQQIAELFGNVSQSKIPTQTSPSNKLHPILVEGCSELCKSGKKNEIRDPTCKSKVHNNNVFEHLCNNSSSPRTLNQPQLDDVAANPTLFKNN